MRRSRLSRKQRFQIALIKADMSAREWCRTYHKVSHQHLSECLKRWDDPNRTAGRAMNPELQAAIERFIKEHS